jgi:hypothetical protein
LKEIHLTRNKVALVDDEDYDRVMVIGWRAQQNQDGRWYAAASGYPWLLMHRFIMRCEGDKVVLHLNEDGLDNRRANLRIGTNSDNQHVRYKDAKGYHWEASREMYKAMINIDGKAVYLGRFHNEADAAAAYKKAKTKVLASIFGGMGAEVENEDVEAE